VRVNPAQKEEARRLIDDFRANAAPDDETVPPGEDGGHS
jgi:hypothetical protein